MGLNPDVTSIQGYTLVNHTGSLVDCEFCLIIQVTMFVLYNLLDTQILKTWTELATLVPLI